MKTPHIVTISGPSLSGKTELAKLLQRDYKYNAVISVTTRPQRAQEKDGVDYYFMNNERYEKLSLIQKTNFNGFNYGVSEEEVLIKQDRPIIWVVAPNSIAQIEKYCNDKNYNITKVFITNPEEVLYSRLLNRFTEDKQANQETYVKRLISMTGTEREWVKEAESNKAKYDIFIKEFNEKNTNDILDMVVKSVNFDKKSLNNKIKF